MKTLDTQTTLHIEPEKLDMSLEPLEEAISDAISDITGFCHNGFNYEIVVTTELDDDSGETDEDS